MGYSLLPLILALSFSLIFLTFGLLFGYFAYRKKKGEAYCFSRDFLFELFQDGLYPYNFIARCSYWFYLVSMLGSIYFFLLPFIHQPSGLFYLAILVCALLLIKVLSHFFLSFIPAYFHKSHIALATLYMATNALTMILSGLFFLKFSYYGENLKNIMAILIMSLGIGELILMSLPSFTNWSKYKKQIDEAGNELVYRPRFFILAFGEWLSILLELLGYLFSLIAFISFI